MTRHRRKTSGTRTSPSNSKRNFQQQFEKVELHQTCKQLKNDLEILRLENKLNQHIQRFVDKRLTELENLPSSDDSDFLY